MKLLKNRVILGLFCGIIAIACIVSYTMQLNETITVYTVSTNISQNTVITEDMIEETTVSSMNMDNVVTNSSEIIGKMANTDLYVGQFVVSSVLSTEKTAETNSIEELSDGKIAYTISMSSTASTVGDSVYTGDIITVFINSNGLSYQPSALKYVEVLSATSSTGMENSDLSTEDVTNITLIVTEEQALLLNEYQYSCTIHLGLVYRGADSDIYIEEQDAILQELLENLEDETVEDIIETEEEAGTELEADETE